jgi:yjeF C-terminal region, hydroxyethylthiazole kinase-related
VKPRPCIVGSFGLRGDQRSFDSDPPTRRAPPRLQRYSHRCPLGTGLSSVVTGTYREAIDLINSVEKPVIAVDIPSGLQADTGAILGRAIRATLTVTCGLPKLGLYVDAGIDRAGIIRVVDIGIPSAYVDAIESRTLLLTRDSAFQSLPERPPSSHKGTFGHAGIIAGSVGKTGAAALAARAALRVGAGLVTVATPSSVNDVLEAKLLEAMTMPLPETKARTLARSGLDRILAFIQARTAIAIGPGLSTHPETVELVQSLMKHLDRPSVLDADALNALTGRASLLTECKTPPILTPHPGEMARLEIDATTQSVNADRIGTARRFARERGVFVVLKGARTVVARPDGLVAICPTGNPGMATAGTGDVLTGMIVGLLAQRVPPWEAACAATYFHGSAGDLAAQHLGQPGMVASDLIAQIPYAFQRTTTTSVTRPAKAQQPAARRALTANLPWKLVSTSHPHTTRLGETIGRVLAEEKRSRSTDRSEPARRHSFAGLRRAWANRRRRSAARHSW